MATPADRVVAAPVRTLGSWLAPILVLLGSFALYAVNLDDARPAHDELYHILAARGLIETGEPRIAEGLYTRALLFTQLVAASLQTFGDTLAGARLPSVAAMAMLSALLFVWLRREAGALAAWLGAGLFAVSPFAVLTAQFVRFYALQALLFFIAVVCVYAAVVSLRRPAARMAAAVAALPPLALAVYLQPVTLLGVVGLGTWAVASLLLPWLLDDKVRRQRKVQLVGALAGLGVAALAVMAVSGQLAELWEQYTWTPVFAEPNADNFLYYHAQLSLFYPTLWTLVAIMGLIAVTAAPAPAGLALTVYAIAFVLNSFGGYKDLRYLVYAQPFLFAIWGIGLAALWPGVRALASGLVRRLAERLPAPAAWRPRIAQALLGGALLFIAAANPFWLRTVTVLADITIPPELPDVRWDLAQAPLTPWFARADVVVVTDEVQFLYHLGRYDVQYSPSKLSEISREGRVDFTRDPRTGRPVIGSPEALARVLDCYPSGIVAVPGRRWGRETHVGAAAVDVVTERARPLELPRNAALNAYVWERAPSPPATAACDELAALGLPPPRRP